MKEFDETKPIQDMFEHYEAQAPEFDSLFRGEVLGDASLRQLCQSKLDSAEIQAPAFDELFAGQTILKPSPKKRMIPLWIGIGVAAACFTLMLTLPHRLLIHEEDFSQIEQPVVYKKSFKTTNKRVEMPEKEIVLTQALESPESIEKLTIVKKNSKVSDKLATYEETKVKRDARTETISKINPSKKNSLAVNYGKSVEEAYAEAKAKKAEKKHEKMTLGTNFISSNRLLSLLNTKSTDTYPLQGIARSYSSAYSSLEGTSSNLVSSDNGSENAWAIPGNLSNDILDDYKAVYSLPLSIGFSVSLPVINHLEIITGLNYTYLSSTVSGETSTLSFNLKQGLHYLGIPLKASFRFMELGKFGIYAAFGGSIEKGIVGVQHSHVDKTDGSSSDWNHSQSVHGLQTGLTGQLGVTYELNKTFNLYIEPGVSYFYKNDQPISSRTEEPYNFNLGIGLRYRIN